MKEIQIPRKNLARSSDPGTKKFNDSELKNRKVAEKRQSVTSSDLSSETTKYPVDYTPISQVSGAISDSDAESFIQTSSLDLLSKPEICLLTDQSPISTITSMEDHMDAYYTDRVQSIADLPASVHSIRVEINELKKLFCSVENSEESNWIDGIITKKFRIMILSLMLWVTLATIVVFLSSEGEGAYSGPLPT